MAKKQNVDPNRNIRVYRADAYPKQIWFFLASFIGLLALFHIGALIIYWKRKRNATSASRLVEEEKPGSVAEERVRSSGNSNTSLRRVPIALINSFRILAYRLTLPVGGGSILNGAEIGLTAGYIITLFTWEFVNCMNVTTGVKLDPAYWANRAANIVATQLPLMVLLAGKNNIISLLTGISYEKINVLHRASARICLVLIWVHFWGRIKQGLTGADVITMPWLRTGIATATAYTLLVLISFRPLRTKFYEFFFVSHFILVLMIIIGAYFHIRLAQGFGPYLIPTFVLWSLDRTLRFLRLVWNNQSIFPATSSPSLDAMAELLSPEMVRITLKRHMTWRAGQNAFITMPGVSFLPFEAHPFTIASIPRVMSVTKGASRSADSSEEDVEQGSLDDANELVFYVKVKEGFTRRLRDAAERQSSAGGGVPLSVYVDGPYGSPPDANAFDKVILIAGGSGISYVLPLLQDIVLKAEQGNSACHNVLFIWAVPQREHLSWVSRTLHEILETAPQSLQLRLRLHVTQRSDSEHQNDTIPDDDTKNPEGPETDILGEKLLQNDRISIRTGRPSMHDVLEEELVGTQGTVSVDVAGPTGLAADVRKALRFDIAGPRAVLKGGPDITLHVETYGIA